MTQHLSKIEKLIAELCPNGGKGDVHKSIKVLIYVDNEYLNKTVTEIKDDQIFFGVI